MPIQQHTVLPRQITANMALPFEVIWLILDMTAASLDEDARSAWLRTCSMVSRAFSRYARKQLFSHLRFVLDLSKAPGSRSGEGLLKFLSHPRNQYVLPNIRAVTIAVVPIPPPRHAVHSFFRQTRNSVRTASKKLRFSGPSFIQRVIGFLVRLDSLKSVTLMVDINSRWFKFHWQEQAEQNADIEKIGLLTTMPRIRRLRFDYIDELPFALLLAPSYGDSHERASPTHLSILCVQRKSLDQQTSQSDSGVDEAFLFKMRQRCRTITHLWCNLSLRDSELIWPRPLRSSSTPLYPALTTVVIEFIKNRLPPDARTVMAFLYSVSSTLETLHIVDSSNNITPLRAWDKDFLGHFSHLRRISFTVNYWYQCTLYAGLESFTRLLLSAQAPTQLQSISISLYQHGEQLDIPEYDFPRFRLPYAFVNQAQEIEPDPWPILDDALCNPNFDTLEKINLFVTLYKWTKNVTDVDEEPQSNLRHLLPKTWQHPWATINEVFSASAGESRCRLESWEDLAYLDDL